MYGVSYFMDTPLTELTAHLVTGGSLRTRRIIDAFNVVDRAHFVPLSELKEAYQDFPLPIGHDQTISQPHTVATMLELLQSEEGDKVLDVGSGSGWTTTLLAHIVGEEGRVYGVELIPELVLMGRTNIGRYPLANVEIHQARAGALGLVEHAPYERILVSAGADSIPEELVKQLNIGGTMVIPVGTALAKVTRTASTDYDVSYLEGFAFVPLVR